MKSKFFKKLLCLATATTLATSIAACGDRNEGEHVDGSKTQITIGVYNGGLGVEWINKLDEAFELVYPQYQVIVNVHDKLGFDAQQVYNNFSSYNDDIFFIDYMGVSIYNDWIRAGYAADISDVITEKLTEFGEDKSILDKMNDTLKDYYYADGVSYGVPWYQASYQTIYDKALFAEKSLYKDADGNWDDGSNKHLGIDGVESFDDGLPRTMSEYKELLAYMSSNACGVTPYTFYATNDFYCNSYLASVFADYEGANDFTLNNTLSGTDSDLGDITLENGYLLKNGQKGKRFALEMAYTIAHDSNNYHSNTFNTGNKNTNSQSEFLFSTETSRPIAMLIDGSWWETEAKSNFDDMASRFKDPSYAYGTREFGVLPIPQADDGSSSTERVICASSGTSVKIVNGKKTAEEIANAKFFLKWLHTNEALSIATAYSNVAVPYEVNVKAEHLALMTPYARELQEVYENSTVVFDGIPANSFLRYEGTNFNGYNGLFSANNFSLAVLTNFQPKSTVTVDDYLAAMQVSQADYNAALEEYNKRVNK